MRRRIDLDGRSFTLRFPLRVSAFARNISRAKSNHASTKNIPKANPGRRQTDMLLAWQPTRPLQSQITFEFKLNNHDFGLVTKELWPVSTKY
jgi:hypothetical protein